MELSEAVRRRRMVRAFTPERVSPAVIDGLIDAARRAPSAGNTSAVRFLVLDTPDAVARYWDLTLAPERRASFSWPGLIVAPVLVVMLVDPLAYVRRYAEDDKRGTGLGDDLGRWSVPYWWVDVGAAVQTVLLKAVDSGLGACFFGLFAAEDAVLGAHGVPAGWRAAGTIAVGLAASDRPGRSAQRTRPEWSEVVKRGSWDAHGP